MGQLWWGRGGVGWSRDIKLGWEWDFLVLGGGG